MRGREGERHRCGGQLKTTSERKKEKTEKRGQGRKKMLRDLTAASLE